MNYSRILKAFYSSTWAILPEKYAAIKALIELRARGEYVSEEQIAAVRAATRPSPRTAGNIAVIPVYGVLCYRANMFSDFSGGTSVQQLTKTFRQCLADDNTKAIIFDVDSPGGDVDGIQEFADEIFNARGQKKMVAVVNTLAASAAYWLASSAEELVVTPSGMVGSIGVFTTHEDISKMDEAMGLKVTYISAGKYKTEGNPDEPLSPEAQAAIQANVDSYYNAFVNAVARNRGVAANDVRNGFGEGRVVVAKDALKMKMVDKIATFDQTLARFGASGQVKPMNTAETESPTIQAADKPDPEDGEDPDECMCKCQACIKGEHAQCMELQCDDAYCKEQGCPQQGQGNAASIALKHRRRRTEMASL
ncbi:MAG TPA: signal peptide peptidase SppA [Candidatus Angelobacter sp.]|nr:signal peptide peptidase SppA [Candidatus Angelobacter sp.]